MQFKEIFIKGKFVIFREIKYIKLFTGFIRDLFVYWL